MSLVVPIFLEHSEL